MAVNKPTGDKPREVVVRLGPNKVVLCERLYVCCGLGFAAIRRYHHRSFI